MEIVYYIIIRGANDASRVRVQLSSSRVINISSRGRVYSSRSRLDSLTFRVELELESSFNRVLIESSLSSSRVVSFH